MSPLESGKASFVLGMIREKLSATQDLAIALNVLVMNLKKLLELLFVFFCGLATPSPGP